MDVIQAMCKVSVEEELLRNPQIDRQMIQSLQDWAKKQPHLPPLLDNQLIIFLVVCKNSVEQAKKLLDIHYTMKTHYKDLFNDRDPLSKSLQDTMEVINVGCLKGLDHAGRRVNFTSLRTDDPSKYHGPTTVKLLYMFEDLQNYYMGSHARGVTVVMDTTGFSVTHLSTLSLSFLRQASVYFTQGANVLVNSIILVNANPVAERLVTLVRPLLPPDIYKRITLLPREKMGKLFDLIPRAIVPSDLGGDGPTIAEMTKETHQRLLDHRDFFLAEQRLQRVNEAARPVGSSGGKIGQDLAGSFKKLDLD